MNHNVNQIQMIYASLLYTLDSNGIAVDKKHIDLWEALSTDNNDVSELVDLLDRMHNFIKSNTNY